MTTPQQREQEIRDLLSTMQGWGQNPKGLAFHTRYLLERVAQLEAALRSIVDYDPGTQKVDLMNAFVAANAYRVARVALTTMPDKE